MCKLILFFKANRLNINITNFSSDNNIKNHFYSYFRKVQRQLLKDKIITSKDNY